MHVHSACHGGHAVVRDKSVESVLSSYLYVDSGITQVARFARQNALTNWAILLAPVIMFSPWWGGTQLQQSRVVLALGTRGGGKGSMKR